jgi:hypothetical protein
MPQLDIISYMSQLFWLLILLALFYLLVIRYILPELKKIQRVREIYTFQEFPISLSKYQTNISISMYETLNHQEELLKKAKLLNQEMVVKFVKTTNKERLNNQSYLTKITKILVKIQN